MVREQEQVTLATAIFNFKEIEQVLDFVKECGLPTTIGRMFGLVYEKDAGIQIKKLESHGQVHQSDRGEPIRQDASSIEKYTFIALPPQAENMGDYKQITVEVVMAEATGRMRELQDLLITFEHVDSNRDSQHNTRITLIVTRKDGNLDFQVSIPEEPELRERLLAAFGITLGGPIQMQGRLLKEVSKNNVNENNVTQNFSADFPSL